MDSLKWMFRGDLSNFPQIQFLVVSSLLMYEDDCTEMVTCAIISILGVLSVENQINVIDHISLAANRELQESTLLDSVVKRIWFDYKLYHDPHKSYTDTGVGPSDTEIDTFHTNLIGRIYQNIFNRFTKTTYQKNSDSVFIKDVSNKTGFATLEEKKPDAEINLINSKSKVHMSA